MERNYPVAQVPQQVQPDVQQPPGGNAEVCICYNVAPAINSQTILGLQTFSSLLWGVHKQIMDHFGFILVLVVGVLIHIYLQQLLQLSPRAQL